MLKVAYDGQFSAGMRGKARGPISCMFQVLLKQLREDADIKGFTINDIEFKLSCHADDGSSLKNTRATTSHHDLPRATTSHHDLPRATTAYHEPPRATTSHHDLPRANTTQKLIHFKNLRNTTSQKLRSIKTVIKQLIIK